MRTLELRIGIALAALAPLSAAFAQQVTVAPVELPKLIFCSGQCFAVDERGVRTPVAKGSVLREGVRLETGPGAYAQLKVGQGAELAVSERGRVSFDQKSVGGRDLVILDQGRIRMIAGEALGKLERRALELRTSDGTFTLKSADVEVKKVASGPAGSNLTYLKLNNGDASLREGSVQVALSKDAVQGITAGKVIADRTFSLNEVALPPTQGTKSSIGPGTTLTIQPAPVAALPTGTTALPITTTISSPTVMTTLGGTTGTCLSCGTTTISPTVLSVQPTTTTSTALNTNTTVTKSTLINNTLNVAFTAPVTTTAPTTNTNTVSNTTVSNNISSANVATCAACPTAVIAPSTSSGTTSGTGATSPVLGPAVTSPVLTRKVITVTGI